MYYFTFKTSKIALVLSKINAILLNDEYTVLVVTNTGQPIVLEHNTAEEAYHLYTDLTLKLEEYLDE